MNEAVPVIREIDASIPDLRTLKEAASLILAGEVVVYPTDTAYGLAADALSEPAIRKLFSLKGRPPDRPVHIVVPFISEADKYAWLDDVACYLAWRFLPGPLTLVLPRKLSVPDLLVAGGETVGIRIPDNRVALELARFAGRPLTATSANVSDMPTTYSVAEVLAQFRGRAEQPALVLDQGPLESLGTSTVLDLTVKPPRVLREGRIRELEIFDALRDFGVESI